MLLQVDAGGKGAKAIMGGKHRPSALVEVRGIGEGMVLVVVECVEAIVEAVQLVGFRTQTCATVVGVVFRPDVCLQRGDVGVCPMCRSPGGS